MVTDDLERVMSHLSRGAWIETGTFGEVWLDGKRQVLRTFADLHRREIILPGSHTGGGFFMTRAEVQQKWERCVAAFLASGERATSWCKANEVNRRQLYTWTKRLGGSSERPVSVSKPIPFVQVAPLRLKQSRDPSHSDSGRHSHH